MRAVWHKAIAVQILWLFATGIAAADCTVINEQIRQTEQAVKKAEQVLVGHDVGLLPEYVATGERQARDKMMELGCNRAANRNNSECVEIYSRIDSIVASKNEAIGLMRQQTKATRGDLWRTLKNLKAERAACRAAERRAARQPAQRRQPPANDAAAAAVIGTLIGIGIAAAGARSAPRQTPIGPASARPQYGPRAPMRCHPGPDGRMHCGGN